MKNRRVVDEILCRERADVRQKRPDYLVSVGQAAVKVGVSRSTMHTWASQGRLGPISKWGSSVALLDLREMRKRGYTFELPEPPQFTASDLRAVAADRDALWLAAISQARNPGVTA